MFTESVTTHTALCLWFVHEKLMHLCFLLLEEDLWVSFFLMQQYRDAELLLILH